MGLLSNMPSHLRLRPPPTVWLLRSIFALGIVLFFSSNLMDQPSRLFSMDAAARADLTDRSERTWSVLQAAKRARMVSEAPGHVSNVMTIASEPIIAAFTSLYAMNENSPIRPLEFTYP